MKRVDSQTVDHEKLNGSSVLRYANETRSLVGRKQASSMLAREQSSAPVSHSTRKNPKPSIEKFNALFFSAMDGYLDHHLRGYKQQLFRDIPRTIVEIGAGTGANFRYYPRGARVVAVEPNIAMYPSMQRAAQKHGIVLSIHPSRGEHLTLDDASVELVVSTLVLCTVAEPEEVLREIWRILVPGGTYRFLEHIAATPGSITRRVQGMLRRPWAWIFEGCSCERDIECAITSAPFNDVSIHRHRLSTPFLPFNTQISGTAWK